MSTTAIPEPQGTRLLRDELFWKVIYPWRTQRRWSRLWAKYGVRDDLLVNTEDAGETRQATFTRS